MSNLRSLLAAVVLPLVLIAGCTGAAAAPLAGRTFLSTKVTEKGADRPLVPGTTIRISFGKDGQLGVNAGCNHMGGTYRLDGETLRFDGGAMTEMGCDQARHDQDDWVFQFLASRPTVALAGNDLMLTAGDVVIRLLDREIADPDLPLVGPTWTVTSIVTGDAVSSIPDGVVASLNFSADGRVELQTGCNQGGGAYAVEGDRIRFADVVTTKRACDGASGQMEAAVLGVLRAENLAYTIEAGSLTLMARGQGLVLGGS
ncbi:MAG TPA: META domain-containing protein [Candidatus Limnocylindrales bacterium]|nr:META domain-containing protein [Candidatus Limnocylindrales bacterium]